MLASVRRWSIVAVALGSAVLWLSAPAMAGGASCASYGTSGLFLDPVQQICGISSGWIDRGKEIATDLLAGLLVIEIIILGMRHALFKTDLGELIGSMSYKIFLAVLMLGIIANADTIFQGISRGFESSGQAMSGSDSATADTIAAAYAGTATAIISSLGAMREEDYIETSLVFSFIAPPPPPLVGLGTGPILSGTALSLAHLHDAEANLLFFLAMVLFGCAGTVLLSYILFTAESFIVIFGGILFLGFAGSSFTQQFSQGYMKYAINNGARLFFFYLVLGIEKSILIKILLAITVAVGAATVSSFSVAATDAAIGLIAVDILEVIVLTSLVYFVPNFVAGALLGQSKSSAAAFLSTVNGAANMMSGSIKELTQALKSESSK